MAESASLSHTKWVIGYIKGESAIHLARVQGERNGFETRVQPLARDGDGGTK